MTPPQKRAVLLLTIVIALTRLLAVAHSMWDWDEGLFSLGVRDYDVAVQHPHPPGYPLFIAAAKIVHLAGVNEFRSLQVIAVLGACALFPVLFWLASELGFPFATAVCGAALFAFFPNVWIYGGTGFSDVPSTAAGFAACALLLRGRRDKRAYVLGAIALGIAAGMRTPNLLLGFVPALMATWHRLRARDFGAVALAIVLGGAIAGGSYLGAALASESIDAYREAVRIQSKWVHDVDSFHNPTRPPLVEVAKVFFARAVQHRDFMNTLLILGAISLLASIVTRRAAPWLVLLMFLPLAVLAWLELDINTAGRYAIAYMAAYALLAADALRVVFRKAWLQGLLCAGVVIWISIWTWPALEAQRKTDSPPAGALGWIARNVPPEQHVYVHGSYGPEGAYLLPHRNVTYFDEPREVGMSNADAWIVDADVVPGAMNFVRSRRNNLWRIVRQRGFEASVLRVASLVAFGDGWYPQEQNENGIWHWMARESRASFAPLPKSGRVSMRMYVPGDLPKRPSIEVWLNGALLERFTPADDLVEKSWVVESRHDAPNELRITTTEAIVPARSGKSHDTRELALRVDALSWTPVP